MAMSWARSRPRKHEVSAGKTARAAILLLASLSLLTVACRQPAASVPGRTSSSPAPAAKDRQATSAESATSAAAPSADPRDAATDDQAAPPAAAASAALLAAADSDEQAGAATADVQAEEAAVSADPLDGFPRERFLLLTRDGPLVIDLVLKIDDELHSVSLERLVDRALSTADADGDGQTLWSELLAHPQFAYGQFGNLAPQDEQQRAQLVERYDSNRNGLVDREEMPRFLTRNVGNSQAFVLRSSNEYREDNRTRSRLRQLLDADRDGAITESEMERASELLLQYDADDDEIVVLADFQERMDPLPPEMSNRRRLNAPDTAYALHDRTKWGSVLYAIQETYAYGERVGAAHVPLVPRLIEQLDANGNQVLDLPEIERLREVPPHLTLEISYDNRVGEGQEPGPALRLVTASPELQDAVASGQVHRSRLSLKLPGEELEFFAAEDPALVNTEEFIRAQFRELDANRNGYLEESEYPGRILGFEVPFAALDGHADGMVFESEVIALVELRQAVPRAQIRARAADQEDALYVALDANGDGRLTTREIYGAPALLRSLDANGDGRLQSHEIPGTIAVGFVRGDPQRDNQLLVVPSPTTADKTFPAWFLGMDTNGDGEISPREFLGSSGKFAQLDANADGFLSAEEAESLRSASVE